MKKISYFIFAVLGLIISQNNSGAQIKWTDTDAIKVDKTIYPKDGGAADEYTIELEAYVTGSSISIVTEDVEPMDIAVILDRSVSVNSNAYSYLQNPEMIAAQAFVQALWDNRPAPEKVDGVDVPRYHNVAAISLFQGQTINDYYANNSNAEPEFRQFTEVNKNLLSTQYNTYKKDVGGGANWGGTNRMDFALTAASNLYDGQTSGNPKVVVIFTAGGTMEGTSGGGNGEMNYPLSRDAVNLAHQLKDKGCKIYIVSVEKAESSAKADKNHTYDLRRYLNYLSSNYNFEITDSSYEFEKNYPGQAGGDEPADSNSKKFYRTAKSEVEADVAKELSDIFTAIARESTTGGGSYNLGTSSMAVIDVMSKNFYIPMNEAGTAPLSAPSLEVWTCTRFDSATKEGVSWKEAVEGPYYEPDPNLKAVVKDNKVTIDGFFYSKDIEKDADGNIVRNPDGTVKQYGNWVGIREITDLDGTKRSVTAGNKLVIKFDVKLNPDYTGGEDVPSNDITSGIYAPDEEGKIQPVIPFPVPTQPFPSICIMKDGLAIGESAIFDVVGTNGTKTYNYRVALTQRSTGNGTPLPCYIILKALDPDATFTVTETQWSWAYTGAPTTITQNLAVLEIPEAKQADFKSAKEYMINDADGVALKYNGVDIGTTLTTAAGKTYVVFREKDASYGSDYSNSAISVLFRFTNTPKTGVVAHAEAGRLNKFAGGTAGGSGGSEDVNPEEPDDDFGD